MSKENEKLDNKEDLSSIDSLSEKDIFLTDEEEENEMLSLLSDMVFTAPYEKYVINTINKIFKDNYKVEPLFKEKKYTFDEIIKEVIEIYPNFLIKKEKKKLNKSEEIEFRNNSLNSNSNNSSNRNNLSENIKIEYNESSSNSLKLNDFLEIFNFNGKEFETHIKILLTEILKCFECDSSSYKLLYNLNFKNEENILDIKQNEIDFLIIIKNQLISFQNIYIIFFWNL